MRGYRLIASPGSAASAKVRAFLRWKNVPYRETLATRLTIRSEVTPRVGRAGLPVLITPSNDTVQDPRDIMDYIERRHPGDSIIPPGPAQQVAARLLETFADEYLVLAALHYRWTYDSVFTTDDIGRTLLPDAEAFERRRFAQKLANRMKARLPALGITSKTGPEIEAFFETFLDRLETHLAGHDCLFGCRPSAADFALMAPLHCMLREPHGGALIRRLAPRVFLWAHRTHAPDYPGGGEFMSGDVIGNGVAELLHLFASRHLPILIDTVDAVAEWAEAHPGQMTAPPAMGGHVAAIGSVRATRSVFPEAQWSFQRVLDARDAIPLEARGAVDRLFERMGAPGLKDFAIRRRLRREHFRLRLELPSAAETGDVADVFSAANVQPLADLMRKGRESADRVDDVERALVA